MDDLPMHVRVQPIRGWYFIIPTLMLLALVLIAQSSIFAQSPDVLSIGITLDLILAIPLVYWLIIRRTKVPNMTTIPVFILGMLVAGFIIPSANQGLLLLIKTWILPVIEMVVVVTIGWKVSSLIKRLREDQQKSHDPFSYLKRAAADILPAPVAYLMATEMAVLYYSFGAWKSPLVSDRRFTVHKKSGTIAIMGILIVMIIVETAALHFLLLQWSVIAAWILTGVSFYSCFQLFGMTRSLTRRVITISEGELVLRYGIMAEVEISLGSIDHFQVSRESINPVSGDIHMSPIAGVEKHNFKVTVNQTMVLIGLYGKKKSFSTIAFHVDDPEGFHYRLTEARQALNA